MCGVLHSNLSWDFGCMWSWSCSEYGIKLFFCWNSPESFDTEWQTCMFIVYVSVSWSSTLVHLTYQMLPPQCCFRLSILLVSLGPACVSVPGPGGFTAHICLCLPGPVLVSLIALSAAWNVCPCGLLGLILLVVLPTSGNVSAFLKLLDASLVYLKYLYFKLALLL